MTGDELVRAWKDPDAAGDRIDHPAGDIAFHYGGNGLAAEAVDTEYVFTFGCCSGFTTKTCICTPF